MLIFVYQNPQLAIEVQIFARIIAITNLFFNLFFFADEGSKKESVSKNKSAVILNETIYFIYLGSSSH